MPSSKALKRQDYIRNLLETSGEVSAKDLAERLKVSVWTVRRDLASLENCGLLRRSYGGADPVHALNEASQFTTRSSFRIYAGVNLEAKRCIGLAAARLLHFGERVAIAGGTTTLEVAKALKLTRFKGEVVTNALDIALELSEEPDIHVVCTGGDVLPRYHTLVGTDTEHMLKLRHFDAAVIGVTGISCCNGITVNSQVDATALGIMMEHSRRTIVVADRSKFGRVCFSPLSPTVPIDYLVTDAPLSLEYAEYLRGMKAEVVIAEEIPERV
jgi:DeoR family transcriptional regulator, aga operon transcriptional repressor